MKLNWKPTTEEPADGVVCWIVFHNGEYSLGQMEWETPTFEETFTAFRYWYDVIKDDGYDHQDIACWAEAELPDVPTEAERQAFARAWVEKSDAHE